MDNLQSWTNIRNKLNLASGKYQFFNGTYSYEDPTASKVGARLGMPKVGWAKRAVEIRSNKTKFDRFDNDTLGLNAIVEEYRLIEAFEKVKSDVLVSGCGFLAVANGRVMPFTATEATGAFSWREQNLKNGIAVFSAESNREVAVGVPKSYIEFHQNKTVIHDDGEITEVMNVTGRPLIGMLTHRSTASQPFGRSVISNAARGAIIDASRTVKQAMVAAYHYNTKVDILLGVDIETRVEKIDTRIGDAMLVGTNENGQIPQVSQFGQHALTPFKDTIMLAANNFCSDTKLNLSHLGINSNAPDSPEALEIVGDDLRDDIKSWQDELGEQIKYFAVTLWMLKNGVARLDENILTRINQTKAVWLPVFRADVSKFGDGLNKIAQSAPAILLQRSIWKNSGLRSSEIDEVIASVSENFRNQQNN